jgi:hypothetical protein
LIAFRPRLRFHVDKGWHFAHRLQILIKLFRQKFVLFEPVTAGSFAVLNVMTGWDS